MISIILANGNYTVLDNDDYYVQSKFQWHQSNGYACRMENSKTLYMHRIINNTPKYSVTDHVNGNKLDNRRCNLRTATKSQNTANSSRRDTKAYRGVTYNKHSFVARIIKNGQSHYIGSFNTPILAALAYNTKALELFGEYAKLNVIEG